MAANDPAMVYPWKLPHPWRSMEMREVILCAPTAENFAAARAMLTNGKTADGLKLLMSGFEFRPDLGDHDMGPTRVGKDQ